MVSHCTGQFTMSLINNIPTLSEVTAVSPSLARCHVRNVNLPSNAVNNWTSGSSEVTGSDDGLVLHFRFLR